MSIVPDFQGFANAQASLRSNFGSDVRFYGPAAMLYDPTIPLSEFDDEGIPLDPLAGASATASAAVSIPDLTIVGSARCNVVFNPLQTSILRRDQTYETALAIRSGLNKDLILAPEDYPQASGATYFQVGFLARDAGGVVIRPEQWTPEDNELWKVVNVKHDRYGPVERVVVYGESTT
jgi:hypothetical protein